MPKKIIIKAKTMLGRRPETNEALRFINVHKNYGSNKVLKGINLIVKKGTIHGFVGPNGVGKTTTMSIAVKLTFATSGDVFVFGESIKENDYTNKHIGFCPAETDMMKDLEVEDLIISYNTLRGLNKEDISKKISESAINRFRYHKIKELSTGWRKIVQIFNVSLSDPKILILDEPFNGLDPVVRNKLLQKIKNLRTSGHTILLSTHILSDLQELVDDITIIKGCEISYTGPRTEDIKKTYEDFFKSDENEEFF